MNEVEWVIHIVSKICDPESFTRIDPYEAFWFMFGPDIIID